MPQLSIDFDGATYVPTRDGTRLNRQLDIVRKAMLDMREHTLSELSMLTRGTTASISARLRDLRKPKYGGYTIIRSSLGGGIHSYRMMPWSEE